MSRVRDPWFSDLPEGNKAHPYPKAQQLARGARRYRRKVASPKRWQALLDEKIGPCRVCCDPASNGRMFGRIQLHHVVPRDRFGDDVADNLIPVCPSCHAKLESRDRAACLAMFESLTDAEYSYAVQRAGEDVWLSVYGIEARP